MLSKDDVRALRARTEAGLATTAVTAAVRLKLEKLGVGIGMADSLIAGIALAQGATLLTRHRRHFERVEGLKLVE